MTCQNVCCEKDLLSWCVGTFVLPKHIKKENTGEKYRKNTKKCKSYWLSKKEILNGELSRYLTLINCHVRTSICVKCIHYLPLIRYDMCTVGRRVICCLIPTENCHINLHSCFLYFGHVQKKLMSIVVTDMWPSPSVCADSNRLCWPSCIWFPFVVSRLYSPQSASRPMKPHQDPELWDQVNKGESEKESKLKFYLTQDESCTLLLSVAPKDINHDCQKFKKTILFMQSG